MNWHKLTPEKANIVIKANKDKEPVTSLEEYEVIVTADANANPDFNNVVGQDSLTRFDKPKTATKKRRKSTKRKKGKPSNNNNA